MNLAKAKCKKCRGEFCCSTDELLRFGRENMICQECISPELMTIRHKIVYGYYDTRKAKDELINKLIAVL